MRLGCLHGRGKSVPFCANALPAADLEVLLVLPTRRVFEAAVAAGFDVCFLGAFLCESALPAADLDFDPVDLLFKVLEAADAAFLLVTFLFGSGTPLSLLLHALKSHVLYGDSQPPTRYCADNRHFNQSS